MSLWTEIGPCVAYHFGSQYFVFKEEVEGAITAEVGSLLSTERRTINVTDSVFKDHLIPPMYSRSVKLKVRWLLQKGFTPILEGKEIGFYGSQSLLHMHRANVCCNLAIEHFHTLIIFSEYGEEKQNLETSLSSLGNDPADSTLKNFVIGKLRKPPIPLLPVMLGKEVVEDDTKTKVLIDLAEEFVDRKDQESAIRMYKTAFNFTNNLEYFHRLAEQYQTFGEPYKAVLVYLYLARLKLERNQISNALISIQNALDISYRIYEPHRETIKALLAAVLMVQGFPKDVEVACKIFQGLASEINKEEATERNDASSVSRYLEYALACCPTKEELYGAEAEKLCQGPALFNLYIKGIIELHATNREASERLYRKAKELDPVSPLPHLAKLSCLGETHPDRFELCRKIGLAWKLYLLHASTSKLFEQIEGLN